MSRIMEMFTGLVTLIYLIVYNLYIPIITAVFPETVHLHFFLFALFKLHILQFVSELFLDLRTHYTCTHS